MNEQRSIPEYLAAVDLGSNSFHMVVARIEDGHIHIQDKLKEMVRLGAGLDEHSRLSKEARQRAFDCLRRFGERVRNFPPGTVAAVGTKTLRQARKSRRFIEKASEALGHPIAVIGGKEEARLVYLGVSHSLVAEEGKRFVMDIGGGSTELIIGENFEPLHLRSLNMGCVSMSLKFFRNGDLNKNAWAQAKQLPIWNSARSGNISRKPIGPQLPGPPALSRPWGALFRPWSSARIISPWTASTTYGSG